MGSDGWKVHPNGSMGLDAMSFSPYKFLGASVARYTANIGWGQGSPSQLNATLVEDPQAGDEFLPDKVGLPNVGMPVYFQHYGFKFFGLLQQWKKEYSPQGNPIYDITLSDPREILEGCQVITGTYNGTTGGIRNLINTFGWWEARGFGASQVNEGGMPFNRIHLALQGMLNSSSYGTYGGPLEYRGYKYSVDLSQLPSTPDYYRIAGPSIGLLDLISQVCSDGGCDYCVELDGLRIVVRTVTRVVQPPLGTLSRLLDSNWGGTVTKAKFGLEHRHEQTSSFLVGGEVSTLNITTSLASFWGYDINNQPILAHAETFWIPAAPGNPNNGPPLPPPRLSINEPVDQAAPAWIAGPQFEVMNLNASPVSGIIASTSYRCSTLEMLMAKCSEQAWLLYITTCRPQTAQLIGIMSPFGVPANGQRNNNPVNLVNDQQAALMAAGSVNQETAIRQHRMYNFVKSYADEYLGKKFLVSVPFLLHKVDSDTLKISASYDVDQGGYIQEGSEPLGLLPVNEDLMSLPDGRFKAFVRIETNGVGDLTGISPQSIVIQGTNIFMEVQVDPDIVYAPTPAVVVTLPTPVWTKATSPMGQPNVMAGVLGFGSDLTRCLSTLKKQFIGLRCSPPPIYPTAAAVPLRSNTLTYGPWFAVGPAGKVKMEQDSTLTPWNYGGYTVMNLAGVARALTGVTNMLVGEVGDNEVAGTPTISLADTLSSGGPNLTGIDVSIGKEGVTTRYRFATFTPRFGLFAKAAVDRLRRMAVAAVEIRRNLRSAIRESQLRSDAIENANSAYKGFMDNAPEVFRRLNCPHLAFISFSEWDDDTQTVRTTMQSATYEEALPLSNADDDDQYVETAMMHLNGLLRPFATINDDTSDYIPIYNLGPDYDGDGLTVDNLDPFQNQTDVELLAWGDSYKGLHAYRLNPNLDTTSARPIALRGPLVMAGWGYDVTLMPVPFNTDAGSGWVPNYLRRQDLWKVGPVDFLWDDNRGVWTCHDALKGILPDGIAASSGSTAGSGTLNVAVDIGSGWPQTVYNYFSAAVDSGSRVICNYIASDHKWYVVAADCSPSGSG